MPNQYNAVSLTPQDYPYTKGTTTKSVVFPQGEQPVPAGTTDFFDVGPVDETITRRPQPSASGTGGATAVSLTTAFDGGVGATKVVDHIETKGFTTNVDPNEPGGLRWGEV
jgi:hypothetical protein